MKKTRYYPWRNVYGMKEFTDRIDVLFQLPVFAVGIEIPSHSEGAFVLYLGPFQVWYWIKGR